MSAKKQRAKSAPASASPAEPAASSGPEISGIHPAAELLPPPTKEEFDDLKKDIEEHGLRVPVSVTPDGLLLDGRSRHQACKELGLPTKTTVYEGDDHVGFVISYNLTRRHLTKSQRAVLAVKLLPELKKRARGREMAGRRHPPEQVPEGPGVKAAEDEVLRGLSPKASIEKGEAKEIAAKKLDTNRKYVEAAEELQRREPHLFKEVELGNLSIPQALRKAKHQEDKSPRDNITKAVHGGQIDNDAGDSEWVKNAARVSTTLKKLKEPLQFLAAAEVQPSEQGDAISKLLRLMGKIESLLVAIRDKLDPQQ